MGRQPGSYRVTRALVIAAFGVVVFRMKIVIEEDGVIRICTQQFLRLLYVIGNIDKIAFETCRKPAMSSRIIVQKKNSNRMALSLNFV